MCPKQIHEGRYAFYLGRARDLDHPCSPKPASRFVPPLVCWSVVEVPRPYGILWVGLGVPRAVESAAVSRRHRASLLPLFGIQTARALPSGPEGGPEQDGRPLRWSGGWPRARYEQGRL